MGVSLFAVTAWGASANCKNAISPNTGSQTQTELCTDDTEFPLGQEIEITARFLDKTEVFLDPDPATQVYTLRLTQFLQDGTQQVTECDINADQQRDCRMTKSDVGEYNYRITPSVDGDWRFELLWHCGTDVPCPNDKPIVISKIDITVFVPAPNVVITSSPPALTVVVDGKSYLTPHSFEWPLNSCHSIHAPSPQQPGNGSRFLFTSWSDGKPQTHSVCTTNESAEYHIDFETQYQLMLSANPPNTGQVISDKPTWYPAGSTAQITAKPKNGFCFVQWAGDIPLAQRTTNPAQLVIDKPKNLIAGFAECVKITVTTAPPGLKILVDGTPYTSTPTTFRWLVGSSHSLGTDSPQPGGAGVRYIFDHWSDTGGQAHSVLTPTQDTTYTAVFRPQYSVTTEVTPLVGGTVNPAVEVWFDPGATATITAIPVKCFGFSGWAGDASGIQNPLALVMNRPKHVIAQFYTGDIDTNFETNPPGQKLIIDQTEYATPQKFTWPICSTHTVFAPSPQDGPPGYRYLFTNWSDKGRQSHNIVIPGIVTTYTANFRTQCALTASVEPAIWGRIRPSGTVWLPCGSNVTLTPRARRGAVFVQWLGDASGSDFPLTIVLDRPKNIIAYLNAIPRANFSTTPVNAKVLETTQFNDLSTDPNGNSDIVSWQWDFGDQTTSTDRNPVHVYATIGRYKPCLTVTDSYGAANTTCKRVRVVANRPPTAAFVFTPTNPVQGQLVTFDPVPSKDFDGKVVQYSWDFDGDGTFELTYSGYATTTHTFTQTGPMHVCLQVTDDSGAPSSIFCKQLAVSQPTPPAGKVSFTTSTLSDQAILFAADGLQIETMRVRVFSLNGRLLFDSDEKQGTRVLWTLDESVANGVYLYLISAQTSDGTRVETLHKLVVSR